MPKADYAKCVDISTRGVLIGMSIPAIFALVVPLVVGYTIGGEAVGGDFWRVILLRPFRWV
jgi:K(+)-stimulated pyrophosphate-energized sodium pump